MRRALPLLLLAVASLVVSCMSPAAPNRPKGEWMPDGTWCSGYVTGSGECVDDGGD